MVKQLTSRAFICAVLGAVSLVFSTAYSESDPYKLRSWNWDYKENWREDRDVFYNGGTQTNAIQRDFRHVRPPGVGDPDDIYWEHHQFYNRPEYDQMNFNSSNPRYDRDYEQRYNPNRRYNR